MKSAIEGIHKTMMFMEAKVTKKQKNNGALLNFPEAGSASPLNKSNDRIETGFENSSSFSTFSKNIHKNFQ